MLSISVIGLLNEYALWSGTGVHSSEISTYWSWIWRKDLDLVTTSSRAELGIEHTVLTKAFSFLTVRHTASASLLGYIPQSPSLFPQIIGNVRLQIRGLIYKSVFSHARYINAYFSIINDVQKAHVTFFPPGCQIPS